VLMHMHRPMVIKQNIFKDEKSGSGRSYFYSVCSI